MIRGMPRTLLLLLLLFAPLRATSQAAGNLDVTPVRQWIAKQDDLHSLSADFVQTRSFHALKSPLENKGHIWFSAPDSFRWQIGDPARAIALKMGGFIYLIDPAKKKAVRSLADSVGKQAGMRGMPMMSFPMARSYADFEKQFQLLSVKTTGGECAISMLPRDVQARKFLKQINLAFHTDNGQLIYFEMVVRDGSSMRNDFENVHVNEKLDRSTFNYDLTGYTITDAK